MSDGTYGYVKRKSIRRIKDGGAKDESIMKLPGEETRFRDSCDRVGRGEEHVEEGMYDEDPFSHGGGLDSERKRPHVATVGPAHATTSVGQKGTADKGGRGRCASSEEEGDERKRPHVATVGPAHATTSVDQKATADEERAANISECQQDAREGRSREDTVFLHRK